MSRRDQAVPSRPHAVARARPVCRGAERELDSLAVGFFYTFARIESGIDHHLHELHSFSILEQKLLASHEEFRLKNNGGYDMRTSFTTAFALAGWMCCGTANAIDISVVSSVTNVQIGDFVGVDLVVSDLGNGAAPSLGAYDVDLNFNAGVLSLVGVGFGTELDISGLGSIQAATSGAGTVNLFEVSFDPDFVLDDLQPGSFSLATLTFQVLAGGTSALDLNVNAFADSVGIDLVVNLVNNGSVTAVPEPSSALLMLLGLLPVGLVARRFRRV